MHERAAHACRNCDGYYLLGIYDNGTTCVGVGGCTGSARCEGLGPLALTSAAHCTTYGSACDEDNRIGDLPSWWRWVSGGSSSAPDGDGSDPPLCKVWVGAVLIRAWIPGVFHTFIVTADGDGNEQAHRGGPNTGGCLAPDPERFRVISPFIEVRSDPWDADHRDYYPGQPFMEVAQDPADESYLACGGGTPCAKVACIQEQVAQLASGCWSYHILGPNSNTVIRTLLHRCCLPEVYPDGLAEVPGWADPYLTLPGE